MCFTVCRMEGFVHCMKYGANKYTTAECEQKGKQGNWEGKREERLLKEQDKHSIGVVSHKNNWLESSVWYCTTLSLFCYVFSGCLPLTFHFASYSLTVTTIHCYTVVHLLNILTSEAFDISSWIMCLYVCHVKAAMMCCKELLNRMEPAKKGLKGPTWQEWTQEAYKQNINLCATYMWVAIVCLDLYLWKFFLRKALNCGTDVSVQLIVPHCLKGRHWTVALMSVCS